MHSRTAWLRGWLRAVVAHVEAKIGLGILAFFGLLALSHPVLLGTVWLPGIYDPRAGYDVSLSHPAPPSSAHLLGTDAFGKDTFSMLLAGTWPALLAGLTAAVTTALVALTVASLSAGFRTADRLLGILVDAGLYLPVPIVLLIFGADPRADRLTPFIFGLLFGALTGISSGALVLRSQAMPIMASGFVDAARIAGATTRQVILRHLLPALLPLACAYVVLAAAGAVVTQGFLSWLSYTATYNDWGTLVYWAIVTRDFTGSLLWHVLLAAGAALTLLTLGFHLLAIGLRRAAALPWSSQPPPMREPRVATVVQQRFQPAEPS